MDAQLVTAHRNLQSLDLAIAALCKKFGDDMDRQRSYWTAENRRDDALERLATTPARSSAGMSLAGDVLRYFSRVT